MQWRDHISIDGEVLVGKRVVTGARIAVELIIDLLGRGYTVEQVLENSLMESPVAVYLRESIMEVFAVPLPEPPAWSPASLGAALAA